MSQETRPLVERVEHFEKDAVSAVPISSLADFLQFQVLAILLFAASLALSFLIPYLPVFLAVASLFTRKRWAWFVLNTWGYFPLLIGIWSGAMLPKKDSLIVATACGFVASATLWLAAYLKYKDLLRSLEARVEPKAA